MNDTILYPALVSDVPSRARTMQFRGLRILGVTPAPTHPTTAGNRARYRALLDHLQDGGATVRLIHINHEVGDVHLMAPHWRGGFRSVPYTLPSPRHERWNLFARRVRDRLGVPVLDRSDADDWCDPAIAEVLRQEVASFRPHALLMMYLWFSAALEQLPPDVFRVLDAHDVFTDRAARMARAGVTQQWFSVSRREEAKALDRFDLVLAIQDQEAAHYRALSATAVTTVSHLLPRFAVVPVPDTPSVLIVGSDNDVNLHGVRWFVREVWPQVLATVPAAKLLIAGSLGANVEPHASIETLGILPDLATAYARAALVINPLHGGTGLKIKGAEALAAGRVVISTPDAAVGLESAEGRGLLITRTPGDMAASIIAMLADRCVLTQLSTAAHEFAAEWNRHHTAAFDEIFAGLQHRMPATSRDWQHA